MKKETESKTIKIKNRYTNGSILESKTATTIKEAVEEAVEFKADLSEADLSKADLSRADLFEANLFKADLSEANLLFCKMDKKVFKQITEEWFNWKIMED